MCVFEHLNKINILIGCKKPVTKNTEKLSSCNFLSNRKVVI